MGFRRSLPEPFCFVGFCCYNYLVMENNFAKNGISGNADVGGFLQSKEWMDFQQSVGRKTLEIGGIFAICHKLPVVGAYLYVPRGLRTGTSDMGQMTRKMQEVIELAKKENVGWVRFEPKGGSVLGSLKNILKHKIVKAPHDMQPKENFIIDISKPQEGLLAEMKSKTRYNIGIAKKKGVQITKSDKGQEASKKHVEEFLKLTKDMALRQGIKTHPEEYYRKMIESLPEEMLKIYVAGHEDKIIAANLVLFFGNTATYLHGASGNESRNVMAPYLLQWQAILDAKEKGCRYYDFGGVKISDKAQATSSGANPWEGITKFKLGFSPSTQPIVFPGSYDIVIDPCKYAVYRILQKIKSIV